MYYRHLKDKSKPQSFDNAMSLVRHIDKHTKAFVPFALDRLYDKGDQHTAIWFLHDFAGPTDAPAVSAFLMSLPADTASIRTALGCLQRIGGEEEITSLRQFVSKSYARNPKILWTIEVEPCIKAIEARLEVEAKVKAAQQ